MINVIAIGYGRQLFDENNPERLRMEACAKRVGEYHMIIFTRVTDGIKTVAKPDVGLYIHPTNARTKLGQIFSAIMIGRKLVKAGGSWVVTSQDPFEAGLVGCKIAGKKLPFNIQEHGDFFSSLYWRKDTALNYPRYYLGLWLLRRATSVRVVSERIRETLIRLGISKEKLFQLAVRSDVKIVENNLSQDQELPDDTVKILSMGRLVRQKNLPMLLRSFSKVSQEHPQIRLILVGSGPEESYLKEVVSDLGIKEKVRFIPWTDDPSGYYRTADIYTLTSDWEGWARVLMEAKSANLPTVTTDVGCAGETFINGQDGFVVPVRDETAFTEKLFQLVSDKSLREQFVNNLSNSSFQSPSLESYADSWADVLEKTSALKSQ